MFAASGVKKHSVDVCFQRAPHRITPYIEWDGGGVGTHMLLVSFLRS